MPTVSMMCPAVPSSGVSPANIGDFANPRTYSTPVGGIVSVQGFEVPQMLARGWLMLPLTTGRPAFGAELFLPGVQYLADGVLQVCDGACWRNATTGAVIP